MGSTTDEVAGQSAEETVPDTQNEVLEHVADKMS